MHAHTLSSRTVDTVQDQESTNPRVVMLPALTLTEN